MDSARLAAIDRLLDAVLDVPPEERAALLAASCADDPELLVEVTRLLEAMDAAPGVVDGTVGALLPGLDLAEALQTIPSPDGVSASGEDGEADHRNLIGGRLGPFQVLTLLAIGGMGEIYLADDTRMRRKVALKLLPSRFTKDPGRVLRFQREARAASALNHPGIVTVYEIGNEEGVLYIASEYVEGETLRQRVSRGPLAVNDALEIAVQMAAALGAAHAAGLVHRDVKPENVMLRRDGYVKVVDFGLVKLIEGSEDLRMKQTSQTISGTVMGTVQYMSPEQARGEDVDARTDLFALGAVIYEMLAGTSPFRSATIATTFDAILNRQPPSLRELREDVPEELESVVSRLLEKDRAQRYATAADARADLLALGRGLEAGTVPTPPKGARAAPRPSDAVRTTVQRRPGRNRLAVALAIAAGVVVDAAIIYFLSRPHDARASVRWQDAVVTRVTDRLGAEMFPSLSADGTVVVYEARDGAGSNVILQRIGSRKAVNLTEGLPGLNTQPAISPDGTRVAFRRDEPGLTDVSGIYVVRTSGGAPRRLVAFGFNPAWSPDGKRIACAENGVDGITRSSIPSRLFVVDAETGASRELDVPDAVQPSWSPDGRRIAFWGVRASARRDLWTASADGGDAVAVTDDAFVDVAPAWAPTGDALYFISNRKGPLAPWRIPLDASGRAAGPPELVPAPVSKAHHVSLSANGKHLALGSLSSTQNIEVLTFDADGERIVGEARQVTLISGEVTNPAISRDGVLAYQTAEHPSDIYVLRPGDEVPTLVTSGESNDLSPRWSPDGTRFAFYSNRGGAYQIWTAAADGSGLTRLTDAPSPGVVLPFFSPDGARLAFSYFGGRTVLIDLPPGAGTPFRETGADPALFTHFVAQSFSPDGRRLAGTGYVKIERGNLRNAGLYVYEIASGRSESLSPFGTYTRWLRDGRRILFVHRDTLYVADLETKRRRVLHSAAPRMIRAIDLAPDDRSIYASVENTEADIWLLSLN